MEFNHGLDVATDGAGHVTLSVSDGTKIAMGPEVAMALASQLQLATTKAIEEEHARKLKAKP